MEDILETHNLSNSEALVKPHTVVQTISLPIKEVRDIFLQREGSDPNYNLGQKVLGRLRGKYKETYPEDDVEELLTKVTNSTVPGTVTGDIRKDSMLIPMHAMNSEGWTFRWFKDKERDKKIVFTQIVDNLNHIGVETPGDGRNDYLSADNPYDWSSVGVANNKTETTYLLMFSSDGVTYEKDSDRYRFKIESDKVDPDTIITKGFPALNERQKYLIQIKWE